MKISRLFVLIVFGSFCQGALWAGIPDMPAKKEVSDISAREKRQKINGLVFEYREDKNNITGEHHKIWKVNGRKVDRQEYFNLYEKARSDYKSKRRNYKEYIESEKESRIKRVATMGSLRLLELTVADLESRLKSIDDKDLKPFYQFAQNSIASQETLNALQDDWLPKARKALRSQGPDTLKEVKSLLASVDGLSDKLQDFYVASVEQGVNRGDSPSALKRWLSVVA